MATIYVYTDGAARGNPGPSASGFIIMEEGKQVAHGEFYNGIATNNFAEYSAVIKALEACASLYDAKNTDLVVTSDSEVVIRQLNGIYKIKSEKLQELNKRASLLATKFKSVKFENARRTSRFISMVDKAINGLLDKVGEQKRPLKQDGKKASSKNI
ncbi:MAG: ribonuclease HI family protein [Candidatus Micrarchaeia archaeon]